MKEKKKLLSSKQTAKELKISRQTLSRYNLPKKVKIGNKDYYNEADIDYILQNGLENYLKDFSKSLNVESEKNIDVDNELSDLGIRMQQQMVSFVQDQSWQRFMRVTFQFDALAELIELVIDSDYTAVFQTSDPNGDANIFSDVDFFPCIQGKNYEEHLETMAKMANDPNNYILRYNILPTSIFKALYREYLFYVFFDVTDVTDMEKYTAYKKQLLDYMLPFQAEHGKTVVSKRNE